MDEHAEGCAAGGAQAAVEVEGEEHLGQLGAGVGALRSVVVRALEVVEVQAFGLGGEAAGGDDPAPRGRQEQGSQVVGQREVPQVVGREHQLVAVRGLAARWTVERHPGVVDDRVEAVQPERVHGCPERSVIGQVQGQVPHLGTGDARADGRDRGSGLHRVATAEHDRGPGSGELLGDEVPDARVAAGDQKALPLGAGQSMDVPRRGLGYGGHGGLPELGVV